MCRRVGNGQIPVRNCREFQKEKHGACCSWGIGAGGRIHRKGLFGVTDEKPVIITAIDSENNLRAILPEILPMVKEGVVALFDTEIFATAASLEPGCDAPLVGQDFAASFGEERSS